MRLRFHPGARDELREAAIWYQRASHGLGDEFYTEIEGVLDRLAAGSLTGVQVRTAGGHSVSKVFLRRFPYALYFELLENQCVIWAVAHGRRRPDYWRGRL